MVLASNEPVSFQELRNPFVELVVPAVVSALWEAEPAVHIPARLHSLKGTYEPAAPCAGAAIRVAVSDTRLFATVLGVPVELVWSGAGQRMTVVPTSASSCKDVVSSGLHGALAVFGKDEAADEKYLEIQTVFPGCRFVKQ